MKTFSDNSTENFSVHQRNTENNEIIKDYCTGNLPELILQKNSPNKAYKNYELFPSSSCQKTATVGGNMLRANN